MSLSLLSILIIITCTCISSKACSKEMDFCFWPPPSAYDAVPKTRPRNVGDEERCARCRPLCTAASSACWRPSWWACRPSPSSMSGVARRRRRAAPSTLTSSVSSTAPRAMAQSPSSCREVSARPTLTGPRANRATSPLLIVGSWSKKTPADVKCQAAPPRPQPPLLLHPLKLLYPRSEYIRATLATISISSPLASRRIGRLRPRASIAHQRGSYVHWPQDRVAPSRTIATCTAVRRSVLDRPRRDLGRSRIRAAGSATDETMHRGASTASTTRVAAQPVANLSAVRWSGSACFVPATSPTS